VWWADSIGMISCTNCIASDLNRSIGGQHPPPATLASAISFPFLSYPGLDFSLCISQVTEIDWDFLWIYLRGYWFNQVKLFSFLKKKEKKKKITEETWGNRGRRCRFSFKRTTTVPRHLAYKIWLFYSYILGFFFSVFFIGLYISLV